MYYPIYLYGKCQTRVSLFLDTDYVLIRQYEYTTTTYILQILLCIFQLDIHSQVIAFIFLYECILLVLYVLLYLGMYALY